ncbi:MAG: hypothetical protein LEGION0398_MBIBDBAK_01133 [Legionellaceae bacterium]
MLNKFLPREENFFKYFQEIAGQLLQASQQFQLMLRDLDNTVSYATQIEHIEFESDKIANSTFQLLNKTFITPFDRNAIHQLTSCLDNTLDHVNLTARYFVIYELLEVPENISLLGGIVARCAELIQKAITQLKSLSNTTEILHLCDAINLADDEAQQITLDGIKDLFKKEENIKQLLKIKQIYQQTSDIVERCQQTANIIRGIVLEYA